MDFQISSAASLSLSVLLLAAAPAVAQFGWPPQMSVDPQCVHPHSYITITLSGSWPDSGVPTAAHITRVDRSIDIVLDATIGVLPVVRPWSLPAFAGQLPAGAYQVYARAEDEGQLLRPRALVGTFVVDPACPQPCYANCDGSATAPILNVDDFTCFINEFAVAQSLPHGQQVGHYVNCDASTTVPALNVDDFTCFINAFAAGCR